MFKALKTGSFLVALAAIVCGVLLAFKPYATMAWVLRVVGIIALIGGVIHLIDFIKDRSQNNKLLLAIGEFALAFVCIFFATKVMGFIGKACGIVLLVGGALEIYNLYKERKPRDLPVIIPAVVAVILGIVMLCGGLNPVAVALRIGGIALIVYGVAKIYDLYRYGKLF